MPVSISPTIPNININGNVYDHDDWENNTPGTISGIANDIGTQITLLASVGVLTKTVNGSGETYLSADESANIGFIFTGVLTAQATVVWTAGFVGSAQIENRTTGAFNLICGYLAGNKVTLVTGESASVFGDGTNFSLQSGIRKTSTGAKIDGNVTVTGNLSGVSGTSAFTGVATFSNNVNITGAVTINGQTTIDDNLIIIGTTYFTGLISITGGLSISGVASDLTLNTSVDSGKAIWLNYATGLVARWLVGKDNVLESGANVGSDYVIGRYSDAGAPTGTPFKIKRSNGNIILGELPTSSAGLSTGTIWSDGGTLKIIP